jgi:hypothetical protein
MRVRLLNAWMCRLVVRLLSACPLIPSRAVCDSNLAVPAQFLGAGDDPFPYLI